MTYMGKFQTIYPSGECDIWLKPEHCPDTNFQLGPFTMV